ncbi:divergent polysaccharide deacetylase family protein [Breoghania sp. L-A4]|uniref:divergent polysaccharide deacetylase family protein n=1 Tax=Breoghania sp. L-A4 TaxID=2304600 RepID=UPI000E35BFCB|nr:divergent polysaccharide deacetylase family protein [Breoghania sp. L-A4]AXS42353.1 divergent polysaccharide deacetylase family protein [Breoghania sp. L-A4]
MAADELTAPLGLKSGRVQFRIPLGLIGMTIIAVILIAATVWIGFVDDPNGGEPSAVVAINKNPRNVSARDISVVGIRPTIDQQGAGEGAANGMTGDGVTPEDAAVHFDPVLPDGTTGGQIAGLDGERSLTTTPDDRITEEGRYGPLPRIGDDGARALDFYARPYDTQSVGVASIAIVVGGLGLSQTGTQEAIAKLPADVTLSFAPYGASLDRWQTRARQAGHELLLQIPLEPYDFPDNDPGPHTLLVKLSPQANADRLHWLMSRISNYVGVGNFMGARFTAEAAAIKPVLEELKRRGLMYFDDGSSPRSTVAALSNATRTPYAGADVVLDAVPSKDEIDARLLKLEATARTKGLAIGSASALPISIERISEWAQSLEARGLRLVPLSASVRNRVPSN